VRVRPVSTSPLAMLLDREDMLSKRIQKNR